ncbi:uncharacterized protein YER152C-like isoform X3 [Athalia rosae]|uniref:uncharacterized protein YER152C-like isoform X3 n=1 Tax=Athalia rosae TaxID=37344 RepID=UPI0020334358|nr:uncharacterized protein YER152C-like isoform X3 [Athalia rosae]
MSMNYLAGRRKGGKVLLVPIWNNRWPLRMSSGTCEVSVETLPRFGRWKGPDFNMRRDPRTSTFALQRRIAERCNFCRRSYVHDSVERIQTIPIDADSYRYALKCETVFAITYYDNEIFHFIPPFTADNAVPMKLGVVDLDAMEKIVADEKERGEYLIDEEKIFWAVFYTIPTYHNPTGMTLSPENCKRLVSIARENSLLVACDDVYNLLRYEDVEDPPQRLFYYDNPCDPEYRGGNVVSNGSFSKILSPAIRLGWMECGSRVCGVLKQSGIMKSGGAVNHYVSGVVASLLELGLEDSYLNLLIRTYKERLESLCNILDRYLPRCCSYRRPEGGYFVWISLPVGTNGEHFIRWCQEKYKVTAIPGSRFSNAGRSENHLRLSIAFHKNDVLEKAVKTLCTALLDYARNEIATTGNDTRTANED